MLFQQPVLLGINSNWYVAHVNKGGLPEGSFGLVSWNPNPYNDGGEYVASSWDASAVTGFSPAQMTSSQLSVQNATDSTTGQMDGDTVGAYLNSRDLRPSQAGQMMMISPQYIFPEGQQPAVFTSAASTLSSSMQLQVPAAAGANTFVSADLLFLDPNGVRLSYSIKLFSYGHSAGELGGGYDSISNSYMFNCPLTGASQFITPGQSSAAPESAPWTGWRTFSWSINDVQFAAAIKYLQSQFPGKIPTTDPTKWVLGEVHLNAQLIIVTPPAELGWSMHGWQVSVTN